MPKVVINACYGGFNLSEAACKELNTCRFSHLKRDDERLVKLVEEWGPKKVGGEHSDLRIVHVPDDVEWEIAEYDGLEHIAEKHRIWS